MINDCDYSVLSVPVEGVDKGKVLDIPVEEFLEEMQSQFPTWYEKLNLVVGLSALTFSVVAFRADNTELVAMSLFSVLFAVMHSVQHYFPEKLKLLRKKKDKTLLEDIVQRGVESKYLGAKSLLFGGYAYWVGLISLFALAMGFKTTLLEKILPVLSGIVA